MCISMREAFFKHYLNHWETSSPWPPGRNTFFPHGMWDSIQYIQSPSGHFHVTFSRLYRLSAFTSMETYRTNESHFVSYHCLQIVWLGCLENFLESYSMNGQGSFDPQMHPKYIVVDSHEHLSAHLQIPCPNPSQLCSFTRVIERCVTSP
jgi:hypothetical protein